MTEIKDVTYNVLYGDGSNKLQTTMVIHKEFIECPMTPDIKLNALTQILIDNSMDHEDGGKAFRLKHNNYVVFNFMADNNKVRDDILAAILDRISSNDNSRVHWKTHQATTGETTFDIDHNEQMDEVKGSVEKESVESHARHVDDMKLSSESASIEPPEEFQELKVYESYDDKRLMHVEQLEKVKLHESQAILRSGSDRLQQLEADLNTVKSLNNKLIREHSEKSEFATNNTALEVARNVLVRMQKSSGRKVKKSVSEPGKNESSDHGIHDEDAKLNLDSFAKCLSKVRRQVKEEVEAELHCERERLQKEALRLQQMQKEMERYKVFVDMKMKEEVRTENMAEMKEKMARKERMLHSKQNRLNQEAERLKHLKCELEAERDKLKNERLQMTEKAVQDIRRERDELNRDKQRFAAKKAALKVQRKSLEDAVHKKMEEKHRKFMKQFERNKRKMAEMESVRRRSFEVNTNRIRNNLMMQQHALRVEKAELKSIRAQRQIHRRKELESHAN